MFILSLLFDNWEAGVPSAETLAALAPHRADRSPTYRSATQKGGLRRVYGRRLGPMPLRLMFEAQGWRTILAIPKNLLFS